MHANHEGRGQLGTSGANGAAGRLRILLAEDDATNRRVVLARLRRSGHDVDVAVDGGEAIRAARESSYDLILMDVQMPGVDGYEATRTIRAGEHDGAHTPIIALTACAHASDRALCLDAGMDHWLSKPVRSEELMAAIARFAPRCGDG